MRLKKKGNYMDGATGRVQRAKCPLSQYAAHHGEYNGFKVGTGNGIGKNALCKRRTINAAVGSEDVTPETRNDRLHCGTTGSLKLMDHVVCVDNLNAKLPEELGKQALPAGDPAC